LGRWKGISEDNPILYMLLKAVKIPIKYFVSHLPLPSSHRKVLRKNAKKKCFGYLLPNAILWVFSIIIINAFHIPLEVTLTLK